MQPIYLSQEIREIESRVQTTPGTPSLMQRAGLAAATFARDKLLNGKRKILVLAGPGNNGGDGLVLATQFRQWRLDVSVLFVGDERRLSADAAGAMVGWRAAGGMVFNEAPRSQDWDLVVDALFGIGLERELAAPYAGLIELINQQTCPRFALDIPSGLHADSGRVLGCAVRATHTMTFIGLKPGLLTLDGPDHTGELVVETLGLDAPALLPPGGLALDQTLLPDLLSTRTQNTHKGSFGSLGIIGGAPGMIGAPILAARAALKLGVGRVYAGFIGHAPAMDPVVPELMLRGAVDVMRLDHLTAMALGPGMGTSDAAAQFLQEMLSAPFPLVLDADALNLLAGDDLLRVLCRDRKAASILTPHPAEAARLLDISTGDVQADRIASALTLSQTFRAHVVLKGAGSVCATPEGRWFINRSGNPGMASAGMGDVLTGIIGALLAQGLPPQAALLGSVFLHGQAADKLVNEGIGPVGLTASELIDAARRLVNRR